MSLNRRHHSESGLGYTRVAANGGGVNSLISNQLGLERKLQDHCRELLNSYKDSQDWSAVGQLAQTLVTSSSRIGDLKRRLLDQEHFPYLEKIRESGQAQLKEASPTPTVLDSLEDSPGKAADLGSSHLQNQQAEDLRCPALSGESTPGKDRALHISQESHFPTSDHTEVDKQTEGVKKSDCVFRVEDKLEDQMEQMANQFFHLNHDSDGGEAEQESVPAVAITLVMDSSTSIGVELEVPEQPKATYTSSESSDQFFSPRNSLSSGEVEDREADQFEDAQSGSEDAMNSTQDGPSSSLWSWGEREIPFVFSIKKMSEDPAESSQIYSIKIPSRISVLHSYNEFLQLREQLASSIEGRSVLVMDSEHNMGSDASAELEAFLNLAASLPSVREMDCFVSFLRLDASKLFHHCGMFMFSCIY